MTEGGDLTSYRVTFLEMTKEPIYDWPYVTSKEGITVLKAQKPPVWYFLALYRVVGSEYEWTDQYKLTHQELSKFLEHSDVMFHTFIYNGWPAGFFILDFREKYICDIAYFGLVKDAIGKGFGSYLIKKAVKLGWKKSGLKKMTVNTNTLDHKAALPLYQKVGFKQVSWEIHQRVCSK